jgi:lysophospholipase L1-like esterase
VIDRSLPADRHTPLLYVALGDSTVSGLGASDSKATYVSRLFHRLQLEYPSARLINRGSAMATAADVLAHQLPETLVNRPNLVTLSVGPNDLRQGRAPEDFAQRVEVILERLARDTDAAVVLNALPDLGLCPRFQGPERSMVAALTRHYNHALRHIADGFGVELVDLSIADLPEHEQRRFFSDDGYHPSDTGYAAWAIALWEAVLGRIPAEPRLAARPA